VTNWHKRCNEHLFDNTHAAGYQNLTVLSSNQDCIAEGGLGCAAGVAAGAALFSGALAAGATD